MYKRQGLGLPFLPESDAGSRQQFADGLLRALVLRPREQGRTQALEVVVAHRVDAQVVLMLVALLAPSDGPRKLAETYAEAIEELNAKHARSPGKEREDELERELPPAARAALEQLLKVKAADERQRASSRPSSSFFACASCDRCSTITTPT